MKVQEAGQEVIQLLFLWLDLSLRNTDLLLSGVDGSVVCPDVNGSSRTAAAPRAEGSSLRNSHLHDPHDQISARFCWLSSRNHPRPPGALKAAFVDVDVDIRTPGDAAAP